MGHQCRRKEIGAKFSILNTHPMKVNKDGKFLWHIVNFTEDAPRAQTLLAMQNAIATWQEAFDKVKPIGRHIILESTSNYDDAHIKIVFCKKRVKKQVILCADGKTRTYNLVQAPDGSQDVLGFVESWKPYVFMDDSDLWGDNSSWVNGIWTIKTEEVLQHELGHIFDLGHSHVKEDIMFPSYDGTDKHIEYDSQDGLQHRWGSEKRFIAENMGVEVCPECPLINWSRIFG